MAPEQARGEAVDARADVFSLGVVLWELCAGRRLFARETDVATLEAVRGGETPSPPSAWNEEVPPALDRVVLAALEHDSARRTASAQELGAALGAVLLGITRAPEDVDLRDFMHRLFVEELAAEDRVEPEATRVRPVPVAAEQVAPFGAAEGTAEEGPTRTVASAPRPRRGRRTALVAGAVLAAAGVALVAARSIRAPSPRPSPPALAGGEGVVIATATPTSTSSAAATPAPAPAPVPDALPGSADEPEENLAAVIAPLESAPGMSALPIPSAASGQGILSVQATPWGTVRVNGHEVGDTPRSIRLPAGAHRVRIERNGRKITDELVSVKAGKRTKILR
jgi:serine/threonine-protein kinase